MDPHVQQEDLLHSHQHRSLYANASCGGTGEAKRPAEYSSSVIAATTTGTSFAKQLQHRSRIVPEDYPESMTRSVSTLSSSHPNSPEDSTSNLRSPVFETALYDPASDSIHIMPHTRQKSLDAQFQDFKDRINNVKSHRSKLISSTRPQSLNLPLRTREGNQDTGAATRGREVNVPARASSVKLRYSGGRSFDLMAPPPGRKRNCKSRLDLSMDAIVEPEETIDADPSDALTSQIASSILRERYGVDAQDAAPLKVQDAVRRCLQDVSSTVEKEHPQWGLPTYHPGIFRSSTNSSGSTSRNVSQGSGSEGMSGRKRGHGRESHDDEEDPSWYGKLNGDDGDSGSGGNGSGREPATKKRAKIQEGTHQRYPCPFRRKNPMFFNIRDHEHCARRPFIGMTELKRHIRTHHRKDTKPFFCGRCKKGFADNDALNDHLTVPLEQMCEPQKSTVSDGFSSEEGITEEMDRVLAERTAKKKVQTWEEIWRLLFGQDSTVLDPEFLPVIELDEADKVFRDSADELKDDLCKVLQQLLHDNLPSGKELPFQVIATRVQLVFEYHRVDVNRRCRQGVFNGGGGGGGGSSSPGNKSGGGGKRTTMMGTADKHRSTSFSSRFSAGAGARHSTSSSSFSQNAEVRRGFSFSASSPKLPQMTPRRVQTQVIYPKSTLSPATSSSIYSKMSSLHSSSTPSSQQHSKTRSNTFSTSNGSGSGSGSGNDNSLHGQGHGHGHGHGGGSIGGIMIQVESPRLPFRDWVQNSKTSSSDQKLDEMDPTSGGGGGGGQRDSGLALPCEICNVDPCQCHYADQLSAFRTPAMGTMGPVQGSLMTPYGMMSSMSPTRSGNHHHYYHHHHYQDGQGGDDVGDLEWTNYGDQFLSSNTGLMPENTRMTRVDEDQVVGNGTSD